MLRQRFKEERLDCKVDYIFVQMPILETLGCDYNEESSPDEQQEITTASSNFYYLLEFLCF